MKSLLGAILVFCTVLAVAAEESGVLWEDYYAMSSSLEEAQGVSLESKDAKALKEAGLYFFSIAHGAAGMKIDKKNQLENAKLAVEYFEAAHRLRRSDPRIITWNATAHLAYAGVSKKISDKIKYSNKGIGLFDIVPSSKRNNLDYRFLRINSYTTVPKHFKDLTGIVQEDGDRYIEIYNGEKKSSLGPHVLIKDAVYVGIANSYFVNREKDEARKYLELVDEESLLKGNSKYSSIVERYYFLKKKLL